MHIAGDNAFECCTPACVAPCLSAGGVDASSVALPSSTERVSLVTFDRVVTSIKTDKVAARIDRGVLPGTELNEFPKTNNAWETIANRVVPPHKNKGDIQVANARARRNAKELAEHLGHEVAFQ